MIYLLIFIILVLADQISKAVVFALFERTSVTVIDGLFSITCTYNKGAAFSMFAGEEWAQIFFIGVTVIAAVIALCYLIFSAGESKWLKASITTILAGAAGNLIDRLAMQKVRDFLFVEFFANCNVADVAVTVGAIMLFIYLLFLSPDALFKQKKNENA